jgi:hypothetical protein
MCNKNYCNPATLMWLNISHAVRCSVLSVLQLRLHRGTADPSFAAEMQSQGWNDGEVMRFETGSVISQ